MVHFAALKTALGPWANLLLDMIWRLVAYSIYCMTKLFIEWTAVSRLLSLFNANYASFLATDLEKLLVNDKTTASCPTNMSPNIISNHIYSHCIHNWPVTREIGNSFNFRRVGPARWWHDALRSLRRIAGFLPASWLVQRSLVEVTSKFRPSHLPW